ncbi:hypothetical protein GLOIN_2v1772863 [Rhizophagus clarus]|uniref:Uncharacterized protein n=1 Tax=Rhizophagus clarus TaxID=94130 RepID=A0A8H3L2G7_9GLOM|nr:hypothetical protein GLOIN_2v1772863 [Rhizophagus clarus]
MNCSISEILDNLSAEYNKNFNFEKENENINLMTDKMRVGEIRHSVLPMEYPPTSTEGITIIYNIET